LNFRLLLLFLLLVGCTEKQSAKLERQFQILKDTGRGPEELCAKAREVANAYLAEENSYEYQVWDIEAGLNCNQAALDRL